MESQRTKDGRRATARIRHLLDALGFGDEVAVTCIHQGDRLECRLTITSSSGHWFMHRFWTDPQIGWGELGRRCLDALDLLMAQRARLLSDQ